MNADIGVIGLAVMGQNLVLNLCDRGFKVAIFNRTTAKVDEMIAREARGDQLIATHSLAEFCATLKRPRRLLLMIKAGRAVDEFIEQALPFLEGGDIVIDGGNSLFSDTNRRCRALKAHGIHFIGAGISGGEEGARHGPSIMPGGEFAAWPHLKPIFHKIAAQAPSGEPCCDWVGEEGAGHFVKMVHNGIEYGDMQLIAEAYFFLKKVLNFSSAELHTLFTQWNQTELNSYLIEITAHIFATQDSDGSALVDKILDVAGQKGTGKWTVNEALELGTPLTLIGEAVFARNLSSLKAERLEAEAHLASPQKPFEGNREATIKALQQALYASKIISYAQGFMLMQKAAQVYGWKLNFGSIAMMWRGGCIIRSQFLQKIKEAYDKDPHLSHLLLDDFFREQIQKAEAGWRSIVSQAALLGIPLPCFSTALAFYDGYRTGYLPTNLLQAQRDYFGAHNYERLDAPRGKFFHTNWTGSGGQVSSSSYNA